MNEWFLLTLKYVSCNSVASEIRMWLGVPLDMIHVLSGMW